MSIRQQTSFSQQLRAFKKSMAVSKTKHVPKLILVVMANTHDRIIAKDCKKDSIAVQKIFRQISHHFNIGFACIEIAGKNYNEKNLDKARKKIQIEHNDDVVLFYYSGHGFSYQKDRYSKYPQLDMRPYNQKSDLQSIDFIRKNTLNLETVLNIMRFSGARITIAIADCCNTTIHYKRSQANVNDMWVSNKLLPPKIKRLTKAIMDNDNKEIVIQVSSTQFGQAAVTTLGKGSIFTQFFTKALATLLDQPRKSAPYIPWLKILKKCATQAFRESRQYDIGGGVAGKQKAVFQAYVLHDSDAAYQKVMKEYQRETEG
jgi:hypothetical protein